MCGLRQANLLAYLIYLYEFKWFSGSDLGQEVKPVRCWI